MCRGRVFSGRSGVLIGCLFGKGRRHMECACYFIEIGKSHREPWSGGVVRATFGRLWVRGGFRGGDGFEEGVGCSNFKIGLGIAP